MGDGAKVQSIRPSFSLERALRLAASGHRDQVRKASGIPYIEHPMGVALILDRAGFDEEVVIAGLLHDLVEDTDVTLDFVVEQFGDRVAEIVAACTEEKLDQEGRKRPWIVRKRDHLATMAKASDPIRAVILADKMHNLVSIGLDLQEGRPVWESFNAGRDQVLWYTQAMIDSCRSEDPRIERLAKECRGLLAEVTDFAKSGAVTG